MILCQCHSVICYSTNLLTIDHKWLFVFITGDLCNVTMNVNIVYPESMHSLILRPTLTARPENEHAMSMFPQYIRQSAGDIHLEAIDKMLGHTQYSRLMSAPAQYRTDHYMPQRPSRNYSVGTSSQSTHRILQQEPPMYMIPEESYHMMLKAKIDNENYKKRAVLLSSMSTLNKDSSSHSKQSPRSRTVEWEDRLKMLVQFKKEHGHCMVPQNHPHLGGWVKWQREKYALYEKGKNSYFTQEKVEALNKLGFVWRVRRKRKSNSSKNKAHTETSSTEERVQKRRKVSSK